MDNESQLFIGANKPHRSVSRSTAVRWIKDQLKEVGINTAIFSAHLVRRAANSKAAAALKTQQLLSNNYGQLVIVRASEASEEQFGLFGRSEDNNCPIFPPAQ